MAAGAGAHLHRFIEGIDAKVLACSDDATRAHLLHRVELYESFDALLVGGQDPR